MRITIKGAPGGSGTAKFYRKYADGTMKLLATRTATAKGNATATVKAPKGMRSFRITYKAPGCSTSGKAAVKIRVL